MVTCMTPRGRLVLLITRGRLRSMTGLPHRLVDVGDTWRALLLGAPPILLERRRPFRRCHRSRMTAGF